MPSRTQRPRLVPALELDLLDSPLDSPSMAFPSATPFSSSLGLTPGSALAEHIFNDPDSWGTDDADLTDDDDDDRDDDDLDGDGNLNMSLRGEGGPTVDPMAWFLEEVQRFRLGSAGVQSESDGSSTAFSFSPDSVGFGLEEEEDGEETEAELEGEGALDKAVLVPSPGVEDTKGVKKMRKSVRPISLAAFFEAGDGIPKDVQVQLEEVLKSGKFPPAAYNHLKALSSGSLTTPSTGDSSSAISTAGTTSSSLSDSSSLASPVIHSASATLSFLEWYGIYPDSPRLDTSKPNNNSLRKSIYTKKAPRRPHLAIPLPKSAVHLSSSRPPSSILSPSVLMPDLSIEAPKRGSAVPPLRDLKPMLERIVGQASKAGAPVESEKDKDVELTEQAQEDGTEKPSTEKEDKENLRPLNPPGLAPRAASPPSVVVVEAKKPTTPPPPPPPTSTPDANVSPPPAVIETAEPAKPEPLVTTKPTLATPPRKIARKPREASPVTPVTKLSTSSASRTPTPPRPRPQALAELSRRRQLLAISVKDSPPPYSRTEGGASTATIGGSRPMPTSTLRTSGSRERLHPPPPATSNPIIRRLPMVPPSAGPTTQGSSSERERSATPPAPPATAVPRTLNSNSAAMSGPASSRPAPSFGSLYSAHHSRSNSNSSSNSSLNPASAHQPGPAAPSPLPSSLPTATAMGSSLLSPEPIGGAQTIVYQARPMSAVRSPMGGVMGPRSRSSTPNNGVRTSSGLARRPPVLNL